MKKPFLTAEWRHLVMLNHRIEPSVLEPLLPAGTQLDPFEGKHYVSIVGFLFLKTKVLGIPVPFHRHFEEVNLRFYVRHEAEDGPRRGVVFIKEVVPRGAIALVARMIYNEPYVSHPMSHLVELPEQGRPGKVEYGWKTSHRDHAIRAEFDGCGVRPAPDSLEAYITEHYWGYTSQKDGSTCEYRVEHPQWNVWRAISWHSDIGIKEFYGPQYVDALTRTPDSVFVADGSAVSVHMGKRIRNSS